MARDIANLLARTAVARSVGKTSAMLQNLGNGSFKIVGDSLIGTFEIAKTGIKEASKYPGTSTASEFDITRSFKMDPKKAVARGVCSACRKKAVADDSQDLLSKAEYQISGMCQYCQNKVFGEI